MGQNGNNKYFSGCFYLTKNKGGYFHNDGNVTMMGLDASLSNSKFGSTENVQPNSFRVLDIIRI